MGVLGFVPVPLRPVVAAIGVARHGSGAAACLGRVAVASLIRGTDRTWRSAGARCEVLARPPATPTPTASAGAGLARAGLWGGEAAASRRGGGDHRTGRCALTLAVRGARAVRVAHALGGAWARFGRSRALRSAPLHHALERASSPLVEIEPTRQRFDAHLQILDIDPETRDLEHEVVDHLVVEGVHFFAGAKALMEIRVHFLLHAERRAQPIRVHEQPQDRRQRATDAPEPGARRLEERVVGELVRGWFRTRDPGLPKRLDERRSHATRIEKLLELDAREMLQFGFRVVRAALLADAGPDLPHDLLDVHR